MRPTGAMRPVGAFLIAALLVGACSSGAAPSVTPSPPPATPTIAPAPTPSPTPVDASAAFAKAVGDPLFMARVRVTGELALDKISMPIEGVLEVRPGASHTVMTIASGASAQTTESIFIGQHKYDRVNGVWFDAGTPETKGLSGAIQGLGGFRDTGVETRNGRLLHHMALPAGTTFPPDAFGLGSEAIADAVVGFDAWSEEDGTPVSMVFTASWNQASGEATMAATMTMELAFTMVSVEVQAPANVWTWQESATFAYKAAYPVDWEYQAGSSNDADWFYGYDGSWIAAWRNKTGGSSLNSITTAITRRLTDFSGLSKPKLDANTADNLAGVKARRLAYHGTLDGDPVWEITVIAVKGSYAYVVECGWYHEPTRADLELMTTFLAQFSMT